MEVRVGVGMWERVQPGVFEAFLCCGSFPVHTNTITPWMSGNSQRVYITNALPGSSNSLNLLLRRRRPYSFSTFELEKPQIKYFLLKIFSSPSFNDYSDTEESATFSNATADLLQLSDTDWRLYGSGCETEAAADKLKAFCCRGQHHVIHKWLRSSSWKSPWSIPF